MNFLLPNWFWNQSCIEYWLTCCLNEIDGIETLLLVYRPWASIFFSNVQPFIVKGGISILNNNNQYVNPNVGSAFQLQIAKFPNELAKVSIPKKLKPFPIQLKSKTHLMAHPISKKELKLSEEPNIKHSNDDETWEESSRKDEMEVKKEHEEKGMCKRTWRHY